jgi:hypothetical protein
LEAPWRDGASGCPGGRDFNVNLEILENLEQNPAVCV